jgi:hypothetical protein
MTKQKEKIKLYHNTLRSSAPSIEVAGLMPNVEKAKREDKRITDVFNMVFNEKQGLYLPKRVSSCVNVPINRNSAIFLSAFPYEFRKSQNLGSGTEPLDFSEDVCFEVDTEGDFPAFDISKYNSFADGLVNGLNGSVAGRFYSEGESEEDLDNRRKAIYNYIVGGDIADIESAGDIDDECREEFSKFREKALRYTEKKVGEYCSEAVTARDIVENYGYMNDYGSVIWALSNASKVKDGLPEIINGLEILCSEAIPADKLRRVKE